LKQLAVYALKKGILCATSENEKIITKLKEITVSWRSSLNLKKSLKNDINLHFVLPLFRRRKERPASRWMKSWSDMPRSTVANQTPASSSSSAWTSGTSGGKWPPVLVRFQPCLHTAPLHELSFRFNHTDGFFWGWGCNACGAGVRGEKV
jgi:hypothetical protein